MHEDNLQSQEQQQAPESAFGVLRRFARRPGNAERCELCATVLAADHEHLIEIARRKLLCACTACAVLFSGQSGAKYKRVPRRVVLLAGFQMSDAQWDSLMIPIGMAFFFKSSLENKVVALYPSPAGATESELSLETWSDIVSANPELQSMEPDVEGLLVNRIALAGEPSPQYYMLPIDECYGLVGLIRTHWRGFSGGSDVWQELRNFFRGLQSKAVVQEKTHA